MKNKKIILIIVITTLLVLTMIGTYAYLSTSDKQTAANTFSSGCLSITIDSETSAISLTNSYPISDVEGLETTPYTFTIKNNCSTPANYQINLENLDQTTNTLSSDYVKVSLSSDTNDNLISILSSNDTATTTIDGAYEAYTLYTGTIAGNGATKTFNLREWIDYDVTVSQGANKTFTNKINIIANPEIEVTETPEIQFAINDSTLTGTITGTASTATYCSTTQNICNPQTSTTISDNQVSITPPVASAQKYITTALGTLQVNTNTKQIICTSLDSNKTMCSNPFESKAVDFSKTSCANGTNNGSDCTDNGETQGIYEAEDDDGTSYYYRGSVDNNYVKFADKYWRIIRINGNGSLRLIYSGEVATIDAAGKETVLANGYNDSSTDYTQVGTSAFNSSYNDNAYVGFMYGTAGSSTYAETHANTNSSTIKTYLETWYNNNLASYVEYLDTESGFCNDRSINSGTGVGKTLTTYAAYNRIRSILKPTLKCQNANDYFTIKNSNKGNKALTYPVGLITADEVAYAGGVYATDNTSYYLYTGNYYWTMSPSNSNSIYALAFDVTSDGDLDRDFAGDVARGVRPVINVKTDQLTITGSGTSTNPYEVSS